MPAQTLTARIQAVRSRKSLAKILGLTGEQLSELLEDLKRGGCYRTVAIPKKNGGWRDISIPTPQLMAVQKVVGRAIAPVSASRIAYCGVSGRSHVSGAEQHVGGKAVAKIDIQNFYPSISHARVYRVFVDELGVCHGIGRILTRLTTWNGALPQGSPASPCIANLIMKKFDISLEEICASAGCVPVRIMDDISISGEPHDVRVALDQTFRLIHRYGFNMRRDKTEIQSRGQGMTVTGLAVDRKVSIPKRARKKGLSRSVVRSRVRSALKNSRKISLREMRRVSGQIGYVTMCNPSFAQNKDVKKFRELLRSREKAVSEARQAEPHASKVGSDVQR